MGKKRALDFEEHRTMGADLSTIRERLIEFLIFIQHNTPNTEKVVRLANRAVAAVDSLKCELDNRVFNEHPHFDTNTLGHVYYGGTDRPCGDGYDARTPGQPTRLYTNIRLVRTRISEVKKEVV